MHDPSAMIRYADQFPQTHHPWIWLNEPQHSAAFTAIMSLIAAVFTGIAAYGAVGAYRAALAQTKLAKAEAERQKHVFEVQMRMAEATLKEQIRPLLVAREDWPENSTLGHTGTKPSQF